jgi:hypothetical protein
MNSLKYFLMGGLLLGAASCEKEEIDGTPELNVTRMEGAWDITQVQVANPDAGTSYTADPDGRFTFEACNFAPSHPCPYTQESSYTIGGSTITTSESGEHRFINEGRVLELRVPRGSGQYDVTLYEVLTRQYNSIRILHRDDDGTMTTYTLVKE